MEEVRTKRKYNRRSPEVIAAEKAAKEARKAAREAAKKDKEEIKMPAKKTEPATEEKKTTIKLCGNIFINKPCTPICSKFLPIIFCHILPMIAIIKIPKFLVIFKSSPFGRS